MFNGYWVTVLILSSYLLLAEHSKHNQVLCCGKQTKKKKSTHFKNTVMFLVLFITSWPERQTQEKNKSSLSSLLSLSLSPVISFNWGKALFVVLDGEGGWWGGLERASAVQTLIDILFCHRTRLWGQMSQLGELQRACLTTSIHYTALTGGFWGISLSH